MMEQPELIDVPLKFFYHFLKLLYLVTSSIFERDSLPVQKMASVIGVDF